MNAETETSPEERATLEVSLPTTLQQDMLDAGRPKDIDARSFFTRINRLHHAHDHRRLCICSSRRRSLAAAPWLRSLGCPKALSAAGGLHVWKKPQAVQHAASSAPAAPAGTGATGAASTAPAGVRGLSRPPRRTRVP